MKKNLTLQLDYDDYAKLQSLASKDNRSIASYIRNLILERVTQYETDSRREDTLSSKQNI